jgi:hypothetical protein
MVVLVVVLVLVIENGEIEDGDENEDADEWVAASPRCVVLRCVTLGGTSPSPDGGEGRRLGAKERGVYAASPWNDPCGPAESPEAKKSADAEAAY